LIAAVAPAVVAGFLSMPTACLITRMRRRATPWQTSERIKL
jgi:hypothetical protein